MHFPANIGALLCASSISLGSLAAATPLCSQTVDTAGGGLPNSVIPTVISTDAIKELQLASFLENLEASFFKVGLTNITGWGTDGYPNDTIQVVSKVAAQEEVHLSSLVNLLNSYNTTPIPPCNYSFPVESTTRFFELADVITSVGIGATIGITERLAVMDPMLVSTVSSMLTVESRHDAFFRSISGEVPNPAPFDTGISDIWAYNLALSFVVPGSCPVELPLPILPRLTVTQPAVAPSANATAPYANATTHMRTPRHQREHHCPYTNTTAPHANSTTAPYTNTTATHANSTTAPFPNTTAPHANSTNASFPNTTAPHANSTTAPFPNATTPYANATAPFANATAPHANVTAPYANATAPTEMPAKLEFTWDPMQAPFVAESGEQLLVGWVNQLNVPVYTPLDITATGKGTTSIPQEMNGVAFAVITVQQPDNFNDLALVTMAGPAIVLLS